MKELILEESIVERETREIRCACSAVLGSVSAPVGTSESVWSRAVSGYLCETCAISNGILNPEG